MNIDPRYDDQQRADIRAVFNNWTGTAGSQTGVKYKESKKSDEFGNRFRYRAKVWDEKGAKAGRWAWDVFLVSGR